MFAARGMRSRSPYSSCSTAGCRSLSLPCQPVLGSQQTISPHGIVPTCCSAWDVLGNIPLAVTCTFTVPSFMLLEPRAIREPVGAIPLVLGLCGLILVLLGILNATAAGLAASRTIARIGWGWAPGEGGKLSAGTTHLRCRSRSLRPRAFFGRWS